MRKLLCALFVCALVLALASCELLDMEDLAVLTDEQAEIPNVDRDNTWRAAVNSTEEMGHHLMYAFSEGYSAVICELNLPQPVPTEEVWADRALRYLGQNIKYYVTYGEDCDTFSNQTLLIELPAYQSPPPREQTPLTEGQIDHKWRNVTAILRERAVEASPNRRAEDFEDFAILRENRGRMEVRDSEQLWIVLEKNYLPIFPEGESEVAENIWNLACDVLRHIITEDMDDQQKLWAIYDYLCAEVQYDHELASMGGSHRTDAAHFPEGVLEGHFAVCDGIAKTAVILCRIEGIECVLVEGKGENGGHAWNAVRHGENWYTFCATYGMMTASETSSLAQMMGGRMGWSSYRTFMAPLAYMDAQFEEQSCSALKDVTERDVAPAAPLQYAVHPDVTVDFHMDTFTELELLFAELVNSGITGPYYMELTSDLLPMDMEMISMAAHRSDPFASVVLYRHTDAVDETRYTVFVR